MNTAALRGGVLAVATIVVLLAGTTTATMAHAASKESAADTAFSLELDCVACHTQAQADAVSKDCLLFDHQALACTACHTDEAALAKKHKAMATKDPNAGKRLSAKNRVAAKTCQTCHASKDLANATKTNTVLTDKNGATVNPHDLPAGHFDENVTCADCHSVHDGKDETAAKATAACAGCHHTDVYECYTCHA